MTRCEVVHKFTCEDYAYFQAADNLGLWPDPIIEGAKLRATITHMMGTGKRSVSIADFLPDCMVPSGPDPEADALAMSRFVAQYKGAK